MKKYLLGITLLTCLLIMGKAHALTFYDQCEGPYVGAFGGANWMDVRTLHHHPRVKTDFNTGYHAGLQAGYRFALPVRVEGEVSYRRNTLNHLKVDHEKFKPHMNTQTWAYMANAYYDLNLHPELRPYVGAGVGYARTSAHVRHEDVSFKGKDDGFAYQGIAGVNYALCEKTDLGLEYRYFAGRKNVNDHSLGLAIKRYF